MTQNSNTTSLTSATADRRDVLRVAVSAAMSAVFGVVLTWGLMAQHPQAVAAQAMPGAAWALGNWGDTTVPAATFAASNSVEAIAPTF